MHCRRHTKEYEIAAANALKGANDKAAAINALSDIRNQLLNNTFTGLNKRAM